MFHLPSPPPLKVWIATLAPLVSLAASASAQDFTLQVTNPDPLNLGAFVPTGEELDLGLTGKFKGMLHYGVEATTIYDTNFFLSETDEEDELSLNVTPTIRYASDPEGEAPFSFTAGYTPIIRGYLNNSDLNGIDQGGDFTMNLAGGKTSVAVFGTYTAMSGTDRLTGEFNESSVMSGGIRFERRVATRTSLFGNFTASMSDYGSGAEEGAEVYTTTLGELWASSERLSLGGSVRYTVTTSDNTGTRDAWALLMETRYRMGERIWFSATLGPELSQNSGDDGGSSLGLTGNITATYAINERLTWNTSIVSAAVPSPDQKNFIINNVMVNTALQRQLTRATLIGGLECNFSQYEDVGTVTGTGGNEQNFAIFLGYNRRLFTERLGFVSEIRYRFNNGQVDWNQVQVSAGLNLMF